VIGAVVVFALAFAASDAEPIAEGEAAPFTGVLLSNERAGDLAVTEAEAQACAAHLARDVEVREAWKAMAIALQQTAEPVAAPSSPFEGAGFNVGLGLGLVGGAAVVVGAFLLAGWTLGVAKGAAAP